MVIKKYFVLFVFVSLLLINSSFALKTVVTLTTSYPNHNITITVLDTLKEDKDLAYINNGTDNDGISTFTFETDGKKDISIYALVRKNGKIVAEKRFDDLISGEPIDLELKEKEKIAAPASTSPKNESIQNTTLENKSQTINNTDIIKSTKNVTEENKIAAKKEDTEKITGAVSTDSSFNIPGAIYYILGAIAIVALAVFVFKRAKPYFSFTNQIKDSSSAVGGKRLKKPPIIKDKELAAAERKIKEAEEEIQKIKERNTRIVNAEKRFEEAQRELDKLRRNS